MIIFLKYIVWLLKVSILVYVLILSENGIYVYIMY